MSGFYANGLRNCPAATDAGITVICTIKKGDSEETVAKKQRKMVKDEIKCFKIARFKFVAKPEDKLYLP